MRNFHRGDFYFQGCALPLSYITLTTALLKLSFSVCCALNILQHSWLNLAAVMFAFFSSNLQCVPLPSCIVCQDTFSCPATCRSLDFLAADSHCSFSPCRNFFLPCVRTGSIFSVLKSNFASVMKLQCI